MTLHGRDALQQLFLYISTVAEDLTFDRFKKRLVEVAPAAEEALMTIAEELRAEGFRRALAETLTKQLTLKFGPLPAHLMSRVEAVDAKTLERWLERILTTDSAESVMQG